MIIAWLFKKPMCSACQVDVPVYGRALLALRCYVGVWDASEAEGLSRAAWAELVDTQLPALALWEAGNRETLATFQYPLPPIEEIAALIEGRV